jgi:hypothetical protein
LAGEAPVRESECLTGTVASASTPSD